MKEAMTLDVTLGPARFELTVAPEEKSFELILAGFGKDEHNTIVIRHRASNYPELGTWLSDRAGQLAAGLAVATDLCAASGLRKILQDWSEEIRRGRHSRYIRTTEQPPAATVRSPATPIPIPVLPAGPAAIINAGQHFVR